MAQRVRAYCEEPFEPDDEYYLFIEREAETLEDEIERALADIEDDISAIRRNDLVRVISVFGDEFADEDLLGRIGIVLSVDEENNEILVRLNDDNRKIFFENTELERVLNT